MIIISTTSFGNVVRCSCELDGTDCVNDPLCDVTTHYLAGKQTPNFPVPALPEIHQWDFCLWYLLERTPVMSDDEWEREEDEWQDYLDSLDGN